ncbi:hypothetical protein [Rhodovulum sp. 12E13]|uniref:hypothetical protein n=1 Tax=Rhodovulum sp. 12E13 TaxID=2203891 RepID=UPI0018F33B29|nr:hypothetical protein [Rhodovulum sp. 12E13]
MAALMLFVPPGTHSLFSLLLSLSLLVTLVAVLALRRLPQGPQTRLMGIRAKGVLPLGPAIALAGLGHLVVLGTS